MKSFTLTPRLYRLLEEMIYLKHITLEDAAKYNQTTFGAFLKRGYVEYDKNRLIFNTTSKAKEALQEFKRAEIMRHINSEKLHAFFYAKIERMEFGKSKIIRFPREKAS